MKEKFVIIFLGVLVLGAALIYFQKDESDSQSIEKIFKAGISLDGDYFCSNIGEEEKSRAIKGAEQSLMAIEKRKVTFANCQEAFKASKELQQKAGVSTTVLATGVEIIKESKDEVMFAASECSLFQNNSKSKVVSGDIYKGTASKNPVTILSLDSGENVSNKIKESLRQSLKKENPRCA